MTDQETILGLVRLGWSRLRIQRETGHRRDTIARYAVAAGGLPISKPAKVTTDPATEPEFDAAALLPAAALRSRSNCESHRPFIEEKIVKGRDAVKRFVRRLHPREPHIKCRFERPPGREFQVDYGEGAKTRHPGTGKNRRPRLSR